MVGTARFELAAYGTQNRRATRLRHAPPIVTKQALSACILVAFVYKTYYRNVNDMFW